MKQLMPWDTIDTTLLNWMPWDHRSVPFSMKGATGDAWVKVLSRDAETGAESLMYKLAPGWSIDDLQTTVPEDLLVWHGELVVGDQPLRKYGYSYRPPGHAMGPCSSPIGATVIAYCGSPNKPLCSKVPVPALDTEQIPWIPSSTDQGRYFWKPLRGDEESLALFRLLRAVAGSTTNSDPDLHGHDGIGGIEQGFLLEGKNSNWTPGWGDGQPIWVTNNAGAYSYHGQEAHPGRHNILEDAIWFKHDGYIHGDGDGHGHAEENFESLAPMFPKVTPAVKALMEGRDPDLPVTA